jgi:hypothetical protein
VAFDEYGEVDEGNPNGKYPIGTYHIRILYGSNGFDVIVSEMVGNLSKV